MAVKREGLWTRWLQDRDEQARTELVEAYLWLVRYVAGRLMVGMPSHVDQDDVEGQGCFGLLEAVNRYDPSRGVRFETFAIPWIRGACITGIKAQQWAPALRKRVRALEQAQSDLTSLLGREPDMEEIGRYLKLTREQLERRISEVGSASILSMDETYTDADGDTVMLQDQIEDENAIDPLAEIHENERRELLAKAIDSLSERERLVIALFYYEQLLGTEISDLLGISNARVSQLHSRALLRLRGKLARLKTLMVS